MDEKIEGKVPIIKEKVKKVLKERHITQKQMCEDLYINHEHFCRCLSRGEIQRNKLISIAQYLDVYPGYFISESSTEEKEYRFNDNIEAFKGSDRIIKDVFNLCLVDYQEDIIPEIFDEFYILVRIVLKMLVAEKNMNNDFFLLFAGLLMDMDSAIETMQMIRKFTKSDDLNPMIEKAISFCKSEMIEDILDDDSDNGRIYENTILKDILQKQIEKFDK